MKFALSTLVAALLLLTACGRAEVEGPQGPPGQSCTSSRVLPGSDFLGNGGVRIDCPGQPPTFIENGAQGAPGAEGAVGPTGATGSVNVYSVQLCPGASNYGTFVEDGLCVGGYLYGVYSDHGGFLTYLPPGAYSSNGIGSACSFTVVSGCQVQQ